jgi:hypothetical protein
MGFQDQQKIGGRDMEPLGDCEWLARDVDDQLALFTSAGSEFVPRHYRNDPPLIERIGRLYRLLPKLSEYSVTKDDLPAGNYSTWKGAAELGLFAFDFDLYKNRGYMAIATPHTPLVATMNYLPWIKDLVVFPGAFSAELDRIDPRVTIYWEPGAVE